MGSVKILDDTTPKNPITIIGRRAGICWGADVSDDEKNYKRGLSCLKDNHGRTFEFACVDMVLDGYSARVIREWYTHIGGSPTRLQASTRYINYENIEHITPSSINLNEKASSIYENLYMKISNAYKSLIDLGIPKEDVANILPLGMTTRIVDHRNLRNLIDMAENRKCNRAYWEYRQLFKDVCDALSQYSDEWAYLVKHYFKCKCDKLGYCPESRGCGKYPKEGCER